jgi:hypothetical protein
MTLGPGPAEAMKENSTWAKLLQGGEEERVRAVLRRLTSDLVREPGPDRPYLSDGCAGMAVALAFLGHLFPADVPIPLVENRLERAVNGLRNGAHGPGMFQGVCGVAFAGHLLSNVTERKLDLSEIDDFLTGLMDGGRRWAPTDYDIVLGAAGLGFYFVARWPEESARRGLLAAVRMVRRRLLQTANGLAAYVAPAAGMPEWRRRSFPDGYYDVGAAHGIGGAIAFLSDAQMLLLDAETDETIRSAVSWLLNSRLPDTAPSRFTDIWSATGGSAATPSRVAWCYGDLGVAICLWKAGIACREPVWRQEAIAVLRQVTLREPNETGLRDASLCHGASGIAHLLNRAHQVTGCEELAQAARRWFDNTCNMACHGDGFAGFRFWTGGEPEWRPEATLTVGAAGVALALVAAITQMEPTWDRAFGICGPAMIPAGQS